MGNPLESTTLQQQAANHTEKQFDTSPDLLTELVTAIMDSHEAHSTMSKKALNSDQVLEGMFKVVPKHGRLWEKLREKKAA